MARLDESKLQELIEAQNKGIVVGLRDIAGIVPRLDIDVLLHDFPKTFNLFILAFDELQRKSNIDDKMGFFQIAGIHGAPKAEWDGMGVKQNINAVAVKGDTGLQAGYCAHGVATFPTWHRPYLAMLEQTIFLKMVEIAKRYDASHRNQYLDAVAQFRLPFWDYFRPRGGPVRFPGIVDEGTTVFPYDYSLPRIFTEHSVSAHFYPNNQLKSLGRNPFHFHEFSDKESSRIEWDIFASKPNLFPRNRTVRYFQPGNKNNQEDVKAMNSVLNELRMDSNRLVLTMLEDPIYGQYDAFATNRSGPTAKPPPGSTKEAAAFVYDWPSGSIEALHGMYHVVVGGAPFPRHSIPGGHMTRVSVAAFDPVFWMHHGQIERLFALWQAIYKGRPGEWFSDKGLADQDLLPFRKPQNGNSKHKCWTSNDAASTLAFGYTYEELSDGKIGADAWKIINDLYQWSVPLTDAGRFGPIPAKMKPLDLSKSEFFQTPVEAPKIHGALLSHIEPITTQHVQKVLQPERQIATSTSEPEFSREWYIDDEVQRLALNGAFTIFYFVKENNDSIPPDSNYIMEPSLAGLTHVFAAPQEICDNCGLQNQQGEIMTSTVPITSLLLDYIKGGQLESLRPEHVKPFLTTGLKWRVVSVNADTQDSRIMSNSKGLRLNISCKKARLPRNSGDISYEQYPEIIRDIIAQASASPTT